MYDPTDVLSVVSLRVVIKKVENFAIACFLLFGVLCLSAQADTEPPAGVGLLLTSDKPLHYVVQYVLPNMPGAKANIQVGDVILGVDDVPSEKIHNLDELIARIRGSNGSTVKLKIATADKSRDVVLTRGVIPSVQAQPPSTMDFGRQSAVYFYQREEIFPDEPDTGPFGPDSVRTFLRNQLIHTEKTDFVY